MHCMFHHIYISRMYPNSVNLEYLVPISVLSNCFISINSMISLDYQFGSWTDWSKCSATCGAGKKTRTRDCIDKAYDDEARTIFAFLKIRSCYTVEIRVMKCHKLLGDFNH